MYFKTTGCITIGATAYITKLGTDLELTNCKASGIMCPKGKFLPTLIS